MKSARFLALLAVLAASICASASTIYSNRVAWTSQVTGVTAENFDAYQGLLTASLPLGNATFSVPGYTTGDPLWVSCSGCYSPIGIALVGNYSMTTVEGMFATPVGAVGADISNLMINDNLAVNVEINNTWYSWSVPYTYPSSVFWGIVAGPGESIDGINFSPVNGYWVGIDNFSYGSSGTPEPGTIAMFGTGVLGAVGLLRRKLML
jgi:hypothetical protein